MRSTSKVLFFDHALQMGGAEYSLMDIISEIRRFEPIFVAPFAKTPLYSELKRLDVKCIPFPMPHSVLSRKRQKMFSISDIYNIPVLIIKFLKLLRKERPSLVYTNTQKAHFIGIIAAKIARIPCVCHFRDILPKSLVTKVWLSIIYTLAVRIIAISQAVAREFPLREKIRVIYNGIKINSVPCNNDNANPKVGYMGQIARWKGVDYFIKAVSIIAEKVKNVSFEVIGSPIFGDSFGF